VGGEYLLKLNISLSPIANKYREGKLQRTLKRELKEPEIGNEEGFGHSRPLHVLSSAYSGDVPPNRFLRSVGVSMLCVGGIIYACRSGLVGGVRAGCAVGNFGAVHSVLKGKAAHLPNASDQ